LLKEMSGIAQRALETRSDAFNNFGSR